MMTKQNIDSMNMKLPVLESVLDGREFNELTRSEKFMALIEFDFYRYNVYLRNMNTVVCGLELAKQLDKTR